MNMTPKERLKIAAAARARWAKMRADRKENSAATKPGAAPEEPITQNHPLAGKTWTLELLHEQMRPSQTNPRTIFPEEAIRELADDFTAQGQLQPCVARVDPEWAKAESAKKNGGTAARKEALLWLAAVLTAGSRSKAVDSAIDDVVNDPDTKFEIVCGERRWRAAGPKFAGLKKMHVQVVCMTDSQMIKAQYSENDKRKDLSALEEGRWFAKLIDSGEYTPDTLATKLGKSRTYVFEKVKLTRLTGPAMKSFEEGKISGSLAAVIAQIPDGKAQALLFKKDRWGNVPVFDREGNAESVRSVERWINENLVKQIPWKLDETFNHAEMVSPACRECPKMSRNMDESAAKGPPRCMALSCFQERTNAVATQLKQEAKEKGLEFWDEEKASNNRHDSRFGYEGEQNYSESQSRRWEQIAKDVPHSALALYNGKVVRVWKREDLLRAGALKKHESSGDAKWKAEQAAARKKAMFDEKVTNRVIEAVLKRIEVDGEFDSIVLLRKLAYALLTSLWDDSIRKIAKRRGVDKEQIQKEAFVEKFGMGECIGVLTEGLLLRGLRWTGNGLADDAATWAGVDVKKIREELRAEEKNKPVKAGKSAKAAPLQKDFGEFLDRVATKPGVSTSLHPNGTPSPAVVAP